MNQQPKIFYRRHLPHYHPPHATYHVVFRLDGSLPGHVIERLRTERATSQRKIADIADEKQKREKWREYQKTYFGKFDDLLDGSKTGPTWLKELQVANAVTKAIHFLDGKQLDVLAYCIMPNHVHLVIEKVGRHLSRADNDSGQDQTKRPLHGRTKVRPTVLIDSVGDLSRPDNDSGQDQTERPLHGRTEVRPTVLIDSVGDLSRPDNDSGQDQTKRPLLGRTEVRPTVLIDSVGDLSRPDNDSGQDQTERPLHGRTEVRPTALNTALRLLKGATARECNRILQRTGAFWQHESYDHVIRDDEELEQTIWYVLFNPVKAGLVNSWQDWPWTFCRM
jgi:REP element-mobilizing transposase RayT